MLHSPQEFYKKMGILRRGAAKAEGNRAKGAKGEKIAAEYLKRQGYKILKRNFRNPFGEVDIIAQKDDVIAFVEVKTRFSDGFGAPSEAVDFKRRERYVNAARYFFANRAINCIVRFDIIEVKEGVPNHIVSAFEARR